MGSATVERNGRKIGMQKSYILDNKVKQIKKQGKERKVGESVLRVEGGGGKGLLGWGDRDECDGRNLEACFSLSCCALLRVSAPTAQELSLLVCLDSYVPAVGPASHGRGGGRFGKDTGLENFQGAFFSQKSDGNEHIPHLELEKVPQLVFNAVMPPNKFGGLLLEGPCDIPSAANSDGTNRAATSTWQGCGIPSPRVHARVRTTNVPVHHLSVLSISPSA